ncbi:glutaredoxin family protein [Candidatus Saccharibacteria bacterium]|nr:glutaredoxin family protein [Candidatus Saccharibacteria bacterium]
MPKNITIFTTSTCSYCPMVKRYLKTKGLPYNEVNLEDHPERQDEVFKASGAMTVPITIVTKQDNTQEVVIGFNLQKLAPAIA